MIIKNIEEMNEEIFTKYQGEHESFLNYGPEMIHYAIRKAGSSMDHLANRAAFNLFYFEPIELKEEQYGPYFLAEYIIAANLIIKQVNMFDEKYDEKVKKAKKLVEPVTVQLIKEFLFDEVVE